MAIPTEVEMPTRPTMTKTTQTRRSHPTPASSPTEYVMMAPLGQRNGEGEPFDLLALHPRGGVTQPHEQGDSCHDTERENEQFGQRNDASNALHPERIVYGTEPAGRTA